MYRDIEPLFVIEESNVETSLQNVVIYEEKYKDDVTLILNREQILQELTNLLLSQQKNAHKINHKVNTYIDLLDNRHHIPTFSFENIKPIVKCKRIITITGDKKDPYIDATPEYFEEHFLIPQKFDTFITQFESLNRDRNNTYLQNTTALYALMKPFVSSGEPIKKDTDAYRHLLLNDDIKECVRLLGSTSIDTSKRPEKSIDAKQGCPSGQHYIVAPNEHVLYEGDRVDIVGFVNEHDGPFHRFDIDQYFLSLDSLEPQQPVKVIFNEYVFDQHQQPIDTMDAKMIDSIHVQFDEPIQWRNQTFDVLEIKPQTTWFFVYPVQNSIPTYQYQKRHLLTHAIIFKGSPSHLNWIQPTTIYEYLHVFQKNALNIIDIDKIPTDAQPALTYLQKKTHISQNSIVTEPSFHIPTYVNTVEFLDFKHNNNVYKDLYSHTQTFIDTTLNRYLYLKSKCDYGYLYILNTLKQTIQHKITTLHPQTSIMKTQLQKLQKQLDEFQQDPPSSKVSPLKIVKRYDTYTALHNDQGRKTYYDKEFDHTPYHLFPDASNMTATSIIQQLLTNQDYQTLTQQQLKREARAILKGKKTIIDGEYAVLTLQDGTDNLFVRKTVEDSLIWIKVLSAPFPLCDHMLPSFKELPEANVLDPFDIVCKKIESAKRFAKYQATLLQVNAIESTIETVNHLDNLVQQLDKDIAYYASQLKLINGLESHIALESIRRQINIKLDVGQKDYSTYMGDIDLMDLEQIYNNVDYADNPGHYILSSTNLKQQSNDNDIPNKELLTLFINLLDIQLEPEHQTFILTQVNIMHKKDHVLELVQLEEAKLRANINKELYEKKTDYKAKADKLVATKLATFEKQAWSKYHSQVTLATLTWLSIILMTSYPWILIKRILPRCVKYFSYNGYPYTKDEQSLTKFFACLLTTLASPDDHRFDSFVNESITSIESKMNQVMDDVLTATPSLKEAMDYNRINIKSAVSIAQDFTPYMSLNINYKPNFKSTAVVSPSIRYVNTLNQIIKSMTPLKQTYNSLTSLINACCFEKLSATSNYYQSDALASNETLKNTKNSAAKTQHQPSFSFIPKTNVPSLPNMPPWKVTIKTPELLAPSSIPSMHTDKLTRFIKDNVLLQKDSVFQQLSESFEKEDWWDDIFYPKLTSIFDNLISNVDDKLDKNKILYLRTFLIQQHTNFTPNHMRATLLNFLRFRLPTLLSKLLHKKVNLKKDAKDPFETLIQQLIETPSYDTTLHSFKTLACNTNHLFLTCHGNDTVLIRNVSIISYVIVSSLFSMFSSSQQKHHIITKSIVSTILSFLYDFLSLNDNNIDSLKQRMEDLREKRKQSLMGSYSADDEARKLQILLKKMGLPINETNPDTFNKEDVESKEPLTTTLPLGQDILAFDNQQQEDANYQMHFMGENVDQDELEEDS
jgi:hypothetical protein